MKVSVLLSALAALFVVSLSVADEQGGAAEDSAYEESDRKAFHKMRKKRHAARVEHRLEKLDTNDDGKVDLSEYLNNAEQRFAQTDANSDGYITAEEMREWGKTVRQKHRKAMREARKNAQDVE